MPISYIILKLIDILKCHNKETKLTKWQIERSVDNLVDSELFTYSGVDNMLENYSFNEEISMFLNDSVYFYEDEEDNIVLYNFISAKDFECLINNEREYYDKELLDKVDDFFDYNITILELLNIKIDKELFGNICCLQYEIEDEYDNIAQSYMDKEEITDELVHKLKLMSIKRNMAYSCMRGNLNLQEYEDVYSYSRYLLSFNNFCELPLKKKNDKLHNFIINDPFHRALFFVDDNEEFNLCDKFVCNAFMSHEEKAKNMFYAKVLEVIDRRVNTSGNEEMIYDLINAKYRLMCSIDTIYGDFILKNYRSIDREFISDFSFIRNEIYYFIDELFLYNDFDMTDVSTLNDYNNTIKSILIEAYYDLTGDEEVIRRIKGNPNYNKEHFVMYLFENVINKSKSKIKRREDE